MGVLVQAKCDTSLNPKHVRALTEKTVDTLQKLLDTKDVFGYVEPFRDVLKSHDLIELFVQVNQNKVDNINALVHRLRDELRTWKTEYRFEYEINLNVIPVDWHYTKVI